MNLSSKIAQTYAFNSEAPDLLLKKMRELGQTLAAAKENPNKNQKAIDFYTGIHGAMKYAWAWMMDMQWLHKRLQLLESENEFLKQYAGDLRERLLKYEVIEKLKISGDFDQVVQAVDNFMNTTDKGE